MSDQSEQARQAFPGGEKFLWSLIRRCPDGIIGVNRAGVINLFNKAAERLTGWTSEEVVGKRSISELYHGERTAREIKKRLYAETGGGVGVLDGLEVSVNTREGRVLSIRLAAMLLIEDGQEVGSVGFFHDLTMRKRLENELRRLSITDGLTGLYNRRHFHATLGEEVSRSSRYGRPLCLIYFDLDNFKPFNDTFGHAEGDNLLRLVGSTARQVLRSQDAAFRLGGDEFALLLVETNLKAGVVAAERFRAAYNDMCPLTSACRREGIPRVSLSLGTAELLAGEGPDNLSKRADLAMYQAKRGGGDRTVRAREQIGEPVEE